MTGIIVFRDKSASTFGRPRNKKLKLRQEQTGKGCYVVCWLACVRPSRWNDRLLSTRPLTHICQSQTKTFCVDHSTSKYHMLIDAHAQPRRICNAHC